MTANISTQDRINLGLDTLREEQRPLVVCSVSGGKDSAAMALHLRDLGLRFRCVFADTGWEHLDTYRYLRDTLDPMIGPIDVVRMDGNLHSTRSDLIVETAKDLPDSWEEVERRAESRGMGGACLQKATFPSRLRRWCTEALKIYPIKKYYQAHGGDVVNAVGVRRAESRARSLYPRWEYSAALKCDVWRPIIDWSAEDVINIHARHGLAPNPLYLRGADRVGCWPCIFSRKSEVLMVARDTPQRIDLIERLELEVSALASAKAEDRGAEGGAVRSFFPGCGPSDLGGKAGVMPIRKVVDWAETGRGGRQRALFHDQPEGCVRWGLCEGSAGGAS